MVSYYKTIDGKITLLEAWEPGCWIRCISPEDHEVNSLIADFSIDGFFPCGCYQEESSHIDSEDGNTLIIIDIPVVEKPDETIAYTTTPLGIIIAEKTVITVSMKESPIGRIGRRGGRKGCIRI